MRIINGTRLGLVSVKVQGPWPCEQCNHVSQYAEVLTDHNRIFCVNEYCRYTRIIDKRKLRIVEPDGSMWEYNPYTGRKQRITNQ